VHRQAAAQLEGSKKFAHDFMERHAIPTSQWKSFTSADEACAFIDTAPFPALVVKACGLAAGKGVVVAANTEEAKAAVRDALDNRRFGDAGAMVVIEELLTGPEVSLFVMSVRGPPLWPTHALITFHTLKILFMGKESHATEVMS
jgi:phosphoribosylamine--glycine ligase/phosphoribosylglycinamide formyltransferase/phosphoribosylformylglycinamidine cyclo-ligase